MIGYSNVSEDENRQWRPSVTNLCLLSKYGQDIYNLYLYSFFFEGRNSYSAARQIIMRWIRLSSLK